MSDTTDLIYDLTKAEEYQVDRYPTVLWPMIDKAAELIKKQAKEIDTLKKQITDMREFCRTLTGSLWPQNETTEALKLYERGVSDEKKY